MKSEKQADEDVTVPASIPEFALFYIASQFYWPKLETELGLISGKPWTEQSVDHLYKNDRTLIRPYNWFRNVWSRQPTLLTPTLSWPHITEPPFWPSCSFVLRTDCVHGGIQNGTETVCCSAFSNCGHDGKVTFPIWRRCWNFEINDWKVTVLFQMNVGKHRYNTLRFGLNFVAISVDQNHPVCWCSPMLA